jgi:hypothetical protein
LIESPLGATGARPESSLTRSRTLASRPRYVDTRNPALAIECPRCGLITPRFLEFCRNCGYALWPSGEVATAAFRAWQEADPVTRSRARRYDTELPVEVEPALVDYEARAHELGIHIFPSSNFPFLICLGIGVAAFGAIPFALPVRLVLGAIGAIIFLIGVVGWVVVEDTRMFPADTAEGGHH